MVTKPLVMPRARLLVARRFVWFVECCFLWFAVLCHRYFWFFEGVCSPFGPGPVYLVFSSKAGADGSVYFRARLWCAGTVEGGGRRGFEFGGKTR